MLAALPPSGFLRDYVLFAAQVSDCHAAYHIPAAFILLAQTVPTNYSFQFGAPLHCNLFSLVVGPSTESRKSSAVNLARDILKETLPDLVGESPGSHEGLAEQLRDHNQCVLFYSEFGDFLAKALRGYLLPLKTTFTDLYDGAPIGRSLANKRRGAVMDPRLSVFGGVTLSFLEDYTEPTDWSGGFFNRFFTVYADRERDWSIPPEQQVGRDQILDRIRYLTDINTDAPGPCLGLTPEARKIYDEWYFKTSKRIKTELPSETRGAVSRAPAMVIKLSMLFAWDYGTARQQKQPWRLGVRELEAAIRLIEIHIMSVMTIGSRLSPSRDMRDRRVVLDAINLTPTRLGQVIRRSKLLKKRAHEIVDTLLEEGSILRVHGPNSAEGEWFCRAPSENEIASGSVPDNVVSMLERRKVPAPTLEELDAASARAREENEPPNEEEPPGGSESSDI